MLLILVKNGGATVRKEEFLRRVWGPTADENYLAQSVSKLRRALEDSADNPRYIKTVAGEGYRFIGDVTELFPTGEREGAVSGVRAEVEQQSKTPVGPGAAGPTERGRIARKWLRIAVAIGLVLAPALGIVLVIKRPTKRGPDYKTMAAPTSPSSLAADLRSSSPSNSEAQKEYDDGLAKLKALNYGEAKDILLKAAMSDPKDALIRGALAEAYSEMGDDADAEIEAKKAVDLSDHLPAALQLLVQGINREIMGQMGGGGQSLSAIVEFFAA